LAARCRRIIELSIPICRSRSRTDVNTRPGIAYGRPDYVAAGCGMGRKTTLYLLERGVRLTGTDGWSWDSHSCTQKTLCRADLEGAQGWARDRLLSSAETVQFGGIAAAWFYG
jgi:hypothetical protein